MSRDEWRLNFRKVQVLSKPRGAEATLMGDLSRGQYSTESINYVKKVLDPDEVDAFNQAEEKMPNISSQDG